MSGSLFYLYDSNRLNNNQNFYHNCKPNSNENDNDNYDCNEPTEIKEKTFDLSCFQTNSQKHPIYISKKRESLSNIFDIANLGSNYKTNQKKNINPDEIDINPTNDKTKHKKKKLIKLKIFQDYLISFNKIKNFKKFLNTKFETIIKQKYIDSKEILKILNMTPREYIEEILKDEYNKKEKIINFNIKDAKIVEKIFGEIIKDSDTKAETVNKDNMDNSGLSDKKEKNNFSFPSHFNEFDYNNIKTLLLDEDKDDKIDEKNEQFSKINKNDINDRKDNLFDRFKTMINSNFIKDFNNIVSEEDQLPEKINNYLINIKSKQNNKEFFENNFRNNLLKFGEKSDKIDEIKIILGKTTEKTNREANDLLSKTPLEFINEILNCQEKRKAFFDADRKMKIKEMENKKCRNLIEQMKKNKEKNLDKLKKFFTKNNKDRYIKIINASKLKEEANKINGYKDFSLVLTENEKKQIDERIITLENLAENPLLYLSLLNERKPRKQNKKINFTVK